MPKDLSRLTKRRVNQLIGNKISELRCVSNNSACSILENNISVLDTSDNYVTEDNPYVEFHDYEDLHNINIEHNNYVNHDSQFTNSENNEQRSSNVNSLLTINEYFSNLNNQQISDEENSYRTINKSFLRRPTTNSDFVQELKAWILKHNISHRSVCELLKILRAHGHKNLPQDVRTLMGTPTKATAVIIHDNGGAYFHFGIQEGLVKSIKKYFDSPPSTIGVQLNCDGLSISNSSCSQFWPVLMALHVDFYTEPFLVGIYHGYSKPSDPNDFLKYFVCDMMMIMEEGLVINGVKTTVTISVVTCDAPAKAYITCTKYPTGYYSCSKCIQEGEWKGRVVFPEMRSRLRTDEAFINMDQEEHHNGISILTSLNIGMVSTFAIDYMHLVCLGVVKRLIQLWIRGPKNVRLTAAQSSACSDALFALRNYIPIEFARQPRDLQMIDKWKATECRQFLLYTGPVVLENILSKTYYKHFLSLSTAIRILCDPQLCISLNDYAHSLLEWFVNKYKKIYGIEYLTHNVHNLLHLANDVKKFGCLDKFSCFKFENFMSNIKGKIQNAPKPLEQVINRTCEENLLPVVKEDKNSYPIMQLMRNSSKIKAVIFDGFTLTTKKSGNHCLLDDGSILFIIGFKIINNVLCVTGNKYLDKITFSKIPCDFKIFNIFKFYHSCPFQLVNVEVSKIVTKCVNITYPSLGYKVLIPLLQNNN